MKKNYSILILAGEIKSLNKENFLNEYLLNIGNSLSFNRILKTLNPKNKQKIYLALNNQKDSFIRFKPFKRVELINVGSTKSIVETINIALSFVKEENIQIIPITTIPDNNSINLNTCCFSDKSIPKENWSSINYLKKSQIKFYFKNDESSYGVNSFAFTGRLLANKKDLKKVFKILNQEEKKDLMRVAEILIKNYKYKIKHEKWYDIGHQTTFMDTRIASITSRYFNNVKYNNLNNSIIKSSNDKEKLFNEFNFYKNLPLNLRQFFPQLYSNIYTKEDLDKLEIEFISNPNLSEIFLFKSIGPNAWIRIIDSISRVFNEIYKSNNIKYKSHLINLYSSKLQERVKLFEKYVKDKNDKKLLKLFDRETLINGKFIIKSIKETVDELLPYLKKYENSINQFIGHGDLCFNNILVDEVSGAIKLIDPKSLYSEDFKIWGLMDSFYDLAKLNHSFKYLYDSIVNDLFVIDFEDNNINLKIYAPKDYEIILNFFEDKIIKKNINPEILRILTSNLFLSMLPLHIDDKDRVAAFAIIGIIIFNKMDFNKLIIKV